MQRHFFIKDGIMTKFVTLVDKKGLFLNRNFWLGKAFAMVSHLFETLLFYLVDFFCLFVKMGRNRIKLSSNCRRCATKRGWLNSTPWGILSFQPIVIGRRIRHLFCLKGGLICTCLNVCFGTRCSSNIWRHWALILSKGISIADLTSCSASNHRRLGSFNQACWSIHSDWRGRN